MIRKTLLIAVFLSSVNYLAAECIACQPANISGIKNMVQRRRANGQKNAELADACRRTNARLANECTTKNDRLHPSERAYGDYQVIGTCVNNCLQCTCEWRNN